MRVLLADLAGAFGLLTRLPVGWLPQPGVGGFARCGWAYPLAGAVVGGIGGGAYWAAAGLGLSPGLAACWTLAVQMLATGALHEDGLADTADGLGGGRTPARKLEIMRDSRIGSYGALALGLGLAVRGVAMADLARPGLVVPALVVAGALGRGSILGLLGLLRPARPDGLAAGLGQVPGWTVAAGLALAAGATLLWPGRAVPCLVAAVLGCLGVVEVARRQLGGFTGDVLGAAAVVTECLVLTVLAAQA